MCLRREQPHVHNQKIYFLHIILSNIKNSYGLCLQEYVELPRKNIITEIVSTT